MPRRPRPLTDQDVASWAAYAHQVRPLPGKAAPAPPVPDPPRPPQAVEAQIVVPAASRRHAPQPIAPGVQPAGLDTASWTRFQQGKLVAARTLDLHGKTAQAAHRALERFLHAAHADHIRCVEIITGRGKGETGGVIRRELPFWLNAPSLRPLILAAAHPGALPFRPLNDGATRILLRRPR